MTIPLVPPAGTSIPPVGSAFLVTAKTPPIVHSGNQECDARLALCRGLAEYITGLSVNAVGGRKVAFKQVHEEYAEPEEQANYPAVKIGLRGSGVYEARSMTPMVDPKERVPLPDGRYLVVPCDFATDLGVEVWSTDPEERSATIIALERAFVPNYNKFSFDLQLPFYFNCRGTYSMSELVVDDDSESAHRRFRVATFVVKARVPFVTLFSFPDARPSFDLQAIGDGADVLVTLEVL